MMTEEELKQIENTPRPTYFDGTTEANLTALIAEVRRLNAAYKSVARKFFDFGGDESWWYEARLEEAFEPEKS